MIFRGIRKQGANAFKSATIFLLFVVAIVCFFKAGSQIQATDKESYIHPHNIKVLGEYSDGKGHIIRTVQYDQGNRRITETIIKPKHSDLGIHYPIKADTINKDLLYLVVSKSKYSVDVVYRKKLIRSYKAVFGPRPMENKRMEGDRCTPEGWFTIQEKNPASKYNKFMLLSYPTDSSRIVFNKLKADGKIPKSAQIGGSVGIHGIWPRGDDLIELGVGWTDGCVAIKNADVDELYSFVSVGTRVKITK